jgi:hypothetical protein
MPPPGALLALTGLLPAAGAAVVQRDAVVLLLLGGVLALGMPRISVRGRRRFWQPWANSGLLPLLVGLAIGPAQLGWISDDAGAALRPLLALLLAAAGVLIGTQLRFAYLRHAGPGFLRRHSTHALLQALAAAAPVAAAVWLVFPPALALGCAALVGACAVATAQRPPMSVEDRLPPRQVVAGHVMAAGWWNLLALAGGSLALSLAFQPPPGADSIPPQTLLIGTPVVLGLVCGWLALRAVNRDDLYLFLLAVLALSGGLALAVRAVPLFFGILVGAVLVNVAMRKSTALEEALEELEQPLAMGIGLLAGLCLGQLEEGTLWLWLVPPVLLASRWLVRARLSPTAADLGLAHERRFAPTGSTGVLLVACAVLAPSPAPALVAPLVTALVVLTLVSDLRERRGLARATAGA